MFRCWLGCVVSLILSGGCSQDSSTPVPDTGSVADTIADLAPDLVVDAPAVDQSEPEPDISIADFGNDADADVGADATELPRFSFFATSLVALRELSGSQDGFGGDLRFGETGPGAGLRGADKICAAIAERSMPGASVKQWRAFLSVTADANGQQVNAIDRIGDGPWYDRLGRLLAPTTADLLNIRPQNGYALIRNDFPNEDGVLNSQPDLTKMEVDNHHFITGSNFNGKLYSQTATCKDWTAADAGDNGKPRCGFSFARPWAPNEYPWIDGISSPGCVPSVEIEMGGPPDPNGTTIGSGGGYGGFYCFALVP